MPPTWNALSLGHERLCSSSAPEFACDDATLLLSGTTTLRDELHLLEASHVDFATSGTSTQFQNRTSERSLLTPDRQTVVAVPDLAVDGLGAYL